MASTGSSSLGAAGCRAPAEPRHTGLCCEERNGTPYRSSTCPIPQRGFQERCSDAQDPEPPSLAAHTALAAISRQMLMPPKEGEHRWVPICRDENNPAGATWSSTLPLVPATSTAARRAKAGRAGTLGSSTASRPQKGWPGAPWQGKLGGL